MTSPTAEPAPAPDIDVAALELSADAIDVAAAAARFREHGALVVRGLLRDHIAAVTRDIEAKVAEALAQLDQAEKIPEGWRTRNGTLFLPAPEGYARDRQVMVVGVGYQSSAALLRAALDEHALDILEAILGPDIELFGNGQVLYKEPAGGHPKHLHQDSAYFEHRYDGPVGILTYCVPTDLTNGALHVVPGSHRLGQLDHVDTFSHLGLADDQWPWERSRPLTGEPGDAIFFHVRCVHGSKPNYSTAPRPVFINRYRRVGDYVTVRGSSTSNRAAVSDAAREPPGILARGYRADRRQTEEKDSKHE